MQIRFSCADASTGASAAPVAGAGEVSDHLSRLHKLPCVVCTKMGVEQDTLTVAHHLESIRDENADYAAIAICDFHHKLLHAMSRRSFEMQTKLTPIDLLALTVKAMETEGYLT